MIIDPIGMAVSHYGRSKGFFVSALAPLGIALVVKSRGVGRARRKGQGRAVARRAGTGAFAHAYRVHRRESRAGSSVLSRSARGGRLGQRTAGNPRDLSSKLLWGFRHWPRMATTSKRCAMRRKVRSV